MLSPLFGPLQQRPSALKTILDLKQRYFTVLIAVATYVVSSCMQASTLLRMEVSGLVWCQCWRYCLHSMVWGGAMYGRGQFLPVTVNPRAEARTKCSVVDGEPGADE